MTSLPPGGTGVRSQPPPNIYTVLLLVAVVALLAALIVTLWTLLSPLPNGYGMELGHFFGPVPDANVPVR